MKGLYCTFRQPQGRGEVESAKTICQLGQEIFFGSQAKGDSSTSVRLHIGCPEGGKAVGIWHSHPGPGGVAEPSPQDISEMLRAEQSKGMKYMCISSDLEISCYEVRNSKRV